MNLKPILLVTLALMLVSCNRSGGGSDAISRSDTSPGLANSDAMSVVQSFSIKASEPGLVMTLSCLGDGRIVSELEIPQNFLLPLEVQQAAVYSLGLSFQPRHGLASVPKLYGEASKVLLAVVGRDVVMQQKEPGSDHWLIPVGGTPAGHLSVGAQSAYKADRQAQFVDALSRSQSLTMELTVVDDGNARSVQFDLEPNKGQLAELRAMCP